METERVKVAYWMNGLGEECSSKVFAEFYDEGEHWHVVRNWRSREFEVISADDMITVRMESPR